MYECRGECVYVFVMKIYRDCIHVLGEKVNKKLHFSEKYS